MAGNRARGANLIAQFNFEDAYGTPRAANDVNWLEIPVAGGHTLGEEQALIDSDLIGQGREMLDPTSDDANNDGDITVPIDLRYFGYWLKLYCGAPTTTGVAAAAGAFVFSAQPTAATGTVTIGGTVTTFVAGAPGANQVQLGVNLAATLAAFQTYLAASADTQLAKANYAVTGGNTLTVTYKTLGTAGNAFTLAASAPANAVRSGPTLTGGANTHTFVSGAQTLPSASVEAGHPEVPSYGMNYGLNGDKMKVSLARKGLLNAVLSLVGQGESTAGATAASATPVLLQIERFAQASGSISKDGTQLANIVSADWVLDNNLEKAEDIRPDGRIDGADAGMAMLSGNITSRFATTQLYDLAVSRTPLVLALAWSLRANASLSVTAHRVFLPKVKRPVNGPKGVQVTQAWKAVKDPTLGRAFTIVLTNDVAGY